MSLVPIPNNRELAVIAGAGVLVLVAAYALTRKGAAEGVGRGVAGAIGGAAVGIVKGIGDVIGLPDPANPQTLEEGRAALAQGDYLVASQKLPAGEFLSAIAAKLSPTRWAGHAIGLGTSSSAPAGDRPIDAGANTTAPAEDRSASFLYGDDNVPGWRQPFAVEWENTAGALFGRYPSMK